MTVYVYRKNGTKRKYCKVSYIDTTAISGSLYLQCLPKTGFREYHEPVVNIKDLVIEV